MAGTKPLSPLRIVVTGAVNKTRAGLVAGITDINCDFLVSQASEGEDGTEAYLTTAQNANLLVVATEAANGFVTYHRRMIKIASVLGVHNFLLAIDVGDGQDLEHSIYTKIRNAFSEYIEYISQSGCGAVTGEVLFCNNKNSEKHGTQTLQQYFSAFDTNLELEAEPFRMAVVSGSDQPSGEVSSGTISAGDQVVILPSARRTKIEKISANGTKISQAHRGQLVRLVLGDGIITEPGDMICGADAPVEAADQFETTLIWMSDEPMMPGRHYTLHSTTNILDATITTVKYSINVDLHEHVAANLLENREIGVCNISLSGRIPFEPADTGRTGAQFILIDKETDEAVGLGAIHFALRRASNVHWQALDVTRNTRAALKGQKPAILWFTGLSGSGKSAIANIVEKKLTSMGRHTYTLDGDNIRHGLNRDLGFTDVDRVENIRRIGEVSKLMADCGLITIVSFISPFRSERQLARELAEDGEFIEIYVDTPLEVAEARDIKGLYKKARAGEIANFTGIDSPYEAPENPEIRVDTIANSAEQAAEMILERLASWDMIKLE